MRHTMPHIVGFCGPMGSGKTTRSNAYMRAWTDIYGPGTARVFSLADPVRDVVAIVLAAIPFGDGRSRAFAMRAGHSPLNEALRSAEYKATPLNEDLRHVSEEGLAMAATCAYITLSETPLSYRPDNPRGLLYALDEYMANPQAVAAMPGDTAALCRVLLCVFTHNVCRARATSRLVTQLGVDLQIAQETLRTLVDTYGPRPSQAGAVFASTIMGQMRAGTRVTPRTLLQTAGTEAGRGVFGEDVWAHALLRRIGAWYALYTHGGTEGPPHLAIVDDVRFENEAACVLHREGAGDNRRTLLWCPPRTEGDTPPSTHASERDMDAWVPRYLADGKAARAGGGVLDDVGPTFARLLGRSEW